jgi:hypothetical protein
MIYVEVFNKYLILIHFRNEIIQAVLIDKHLNKKLYAI